MTGADCAPGDEIPVRVVGVFLRNDQDHKLVAVPADRAETDLSELPEAERTALSRVYPRVDAGEGWFGAECAEKVIAEFCANRGQTV